MDYKKKYALNDIEGFFMSQLELWPLAGENYSGLKKVMLKELRMPGGCIVRVQFNPARIKSSAARIDKKSISKRPCFLCSQNLPPEQEKVVFDDRYLVLVNPYPIFSRHLTIALKDHEDQLIEGRFADMLRLAEVLKDYTVFYNGPRCGASAPDHFHFQAGEKGFMPAEEEVNKLQRKLIVDYGSILLSTIENYHRRILILEGDNIEDIEQRFKDIYKILHQIQGATDEPMLNILTGNYGRLWRVMVFPRGRHRPQQFYEEGERQILLSPASVDFGGVWITPRQKDFEKIDYSLVSDIFGQVTLGEDEWEDLIERLKRNK
jgi:hypothetical protein